MSTIHPTLARSARRNRRYLIALLVLALLAVASIANALYLRTQPVAVNDLEARAAALPASAELTSERAADAYATRLDNLRRQGQTATGRVAVPDARPADSYVDQLDTLRQQSQTAAPASAGYGEPIERLRLNDALHAPRQLGQSSQGAVDNSSTGQSISDPYKALKVRQLEQADGIQGRAATRPARRSSGATLSAQERYQQLKAQQIEH